MSYSDLYKYCQTLPNPVSRSRIVPKVVELTRRQGPPLVLLRGLDRGVIAGFTVWPGSTDHPFARWGKGEPVIVVARDHNYCWRRFVVVKELMHYFDQPLEKVTTGAEFSDLITEFSSPGLERSQAMNSEVRALWMALGVFCPEGLRQELERRRLGGEVTDDQIAQMLKIPLFYVPSLFHPGFKEIMAHLCATC